MWECLDFPLVQEGSFCGIWNLALTILSFHPLKNVLPLPSGLWVSDEKPAVIRICFLLQVRCHFFFTAFKIFFFVFIAQKFGSDVFWWGFLWVYSIWGSLASQIHRFMSFAKLKFSLLISLTGLAQSSRSSPSGTLDFMNVIPFVSPTGLWGSIL